MQSPENSADAPDTRSSAVGRVSTATGASSSFTVMEKVCVASGDTVLATRTTTSTVMAVVGVQEMRPVAASMDMPGGEVVSEYVGDGRARASTSYRYGLPTTAVVSAVEVMRGASDSSSASVTVTARESRPGADTVKVATPSALSASWAAPSVTVCGVFQLAVVKASEAPDCTERSVSPEVRATVTVTLPAGARVSDTSNVAVPPSLTFTLLDESTSCAELSSMVVASTDSEVSPLDATVKVAVSTTASASSSASIVTTRGTLQFSGVKVKVETPDTRRSVLPPAARKASTMTGAEGASASRTVKVARPPST